MPRLSPSIATAVVVVALLAMAVVVVFPFMHLLANSMLLLPNATLTNSTNTNVTVVATGNTTITMKEPQYYTQQYNVLLTLYGILADPFDDIIVFAMLLGLAFVYWFLRER